MTNMVYSTCLWNLKRKNSKLIAKREQNDGCQGLGGGRNGEMLVQQYKLRRQRSSEDLMYNTGSTVKNNVLYT